MSVYTPVSLEEANALLSGFDIGLAQTVVGITEGVVNSNFRLTTTRGRYILTLIENPEQGLHLPWLVALLDLLSRAGLPVPAPIRDRQQQAVHRLNQRDCLLVTLLPGISPDPVTPEHCRQVGTALGQLHQNHDMVQRDNPMGLAKWYALLHAMTPRLAREEPATLALLQQELSLAKAFFSQQELPEGLCHGDLFPDNTLFEHRQLTGVIDFHFACRDKWLYDLAIAINAWCFLADGSLSLPHAVGLWAGYRSQRDLLPLEWRHLDLACRTASLRFALTRLTARLFPRAGQQVTRKPPEEYLRRMRFHQENSISRMLQAG